MLPLQQQHQPAASLLPTLRQTQELLAASLPGQQLLKCEVLAALGRAHGVLGEAAFQRQAFAKGLELCKDGSAGGGGAPAAVK